MCEFRPRKMAAIGLLAVQLFFNFTLARGQQQTPGKDEAPAAAALYQRGH
jgi:hypothetical protein